MNLVCLPSDPTKLSKEEINHIMYTRKSFMLCFKIYEDQKTRIDELVPRHFESRAAAIKFMLMWSIKFFQYEMIPVDFVKKRKFFKKFPISMRITLGLLGKINKFQLKEKTYGNNANRSVIIRKCIDLYFLNEDNRLLLCNNILYFEEE